MNRPTAALKENKIQKTVMLPVIILALVFGVAPAFGEKRDLTGPPVDPDRFIVIHGDILVPREFEGKRFTPTAWTDGVVYFDFDSNVTAADREKALEAMQEWIDTDSDVAFVPRLNEPDYVHLQTVASGYSANVGMQGGEQYVSISNWDQKYKVVHELCHSLGYWHEHSRADRDTFVVVIDANIEAGAEHNFDVETDWLAQNTSYDFGSVMHYPECGFSLCNDCPSATACNTYTNGGRTIVMRAGYESYQTVIGQRDSISTRDAQDVEDEYGSGDATYVDHTAGSSSGDGTLPDPYTAFGDGVTGNPNNGTLWIRSASYDTTGTFSRPGKWRAYLGNVTIGQ